MDGVQCPRRYQVSNTGDRGSDARRPGRFARPHELQHPADAGDRESIAWRELEHAFGWFHGQARRSRIAYIVLKCATIAAGASVPLLITNDRWLLGASLAGAFVAVAEGVQQLLHNHENWIRYRTTAELLRREAFAFAARLGPYDHLEADVRQRRLAEHVQSILVGENQTWTQLRQQDDAQPA
jgi:Protein of unknown function (DUF4231)